MVYVVERYLPGVSHSELERKLERLERATRELRDEGTPVHYLGSTIVLEDEACFCQFEGSSKEAVVEANRRAGVPFDRIVTAVRILGGADQRRDDESEELDDRCRSSSLRIARGGACPGA